MGNLTLREIITLVACWWRSRILGAEWSFLFYFLIAFPLLSMVYGQVDGYIYWQDSLRLLYLSIIREYREVASAEALGNLTFINPYGNVI